MLRAASQYHEYSISCVTLIASRLVAVIQCNFNVANLDANEPIRGIMIGVSEIPLL